MHNLQELNIWKKAIDLSVKIYDITSSFPTDEKYGLSSQMRRASVSIASNIAEGAGRNSSKEFVYFLGLSNGSCFELETQLIIAQRLSLTLKTSGLIDELHEIQKMNYRFQEYLKSSSVNEPEMEYNKTDTSNLNTQI